MPVPLTSVAKQPKMYNVIDGFLVCPVCRRNKRLLRVDAKTHAEHLAVWCRTCKHEIILDIDEGQCFESRSQ